MKLIDILVEELPKSGGWLSDVKTMTQDRVGNIWGYDCVSPRLKGGLWSSKSGDDLVRDSKVEARNLAVDWSTAIITREQYEAALASKNEGWIEWGGGNCPVEKGTLIDVKHRDGEIYQNKPAMGENNSRWSHFGSHGDIIAYRLHKPQEAEQAKSDDEAGLNECIGQTPAPVWRGEGFPPVGCECEWQDKNTKQWQPVKVVYASEWVTVVREINEERGDDLVEVAIENYGDDSRLKFRPLRTEAERKREAAIKELTSVICGEIPDTGMATAAMYAARAYDAIAAGKIPGVKLEDL